jgi:hypothetical protein
MNNKIANASLLQRINQSTFITSRIAHDLHKYGVQNKAETTNVKSSIDATGKHVGWRLTTYKRCLTRCQNNLQHKTLQTRMVNTFGIVLVNVTIWWINK